MLIGHYALGFAARKVAPRAPMALLLTAPFLLDLMWPLFYFFGVERFDIDRSERAFLVLKLEHVPWTHGLLASVGWALLLALPYFLWRKDARGAVVLGALVLSHWVLDAITHVPDMPLWWGGPVVGLGLWRSTVATVAVEGALFVGCLAVYARATRPKSASGRWALGSLVALLTVIYLSSVVGPPPPSAPAVAGFALISWLAIPWGIWLDRTRPNAAAAKTGA